MANVEGSSLHSILSLFGSLGGWKSHRCQILRTIDLKFEAACWQEINVSQHLLFNGPGHDAGSLECPGRRSIDLLKQGPLRPALKGLCIGCGVAHAVLALRENGISDASGIDLGLVLQAQASALFAVEIERTLKPSGVAIIVLLPSRTVKGSKPLSPLQKPRSRSCDRGEEFFSNRAAQVALASNPVHHCSPLKHNRNLVKLAEPLTENHNNAIFF
ncbi:hypothetical protein SUGI_0846760 [Cryptomeria japonica]|nr:hypothetical protein SUGI_0846760 [Cryptomeria japonica]